jgi:phosphohistidine swiveling domain-containing protein
MNKKVQKLEKEKVNLKKWEFEFQQRSEQTISLCDLFCRAGAEHMFRFGTDNSDFFDALFTDSSKGYHNGAQRELILESLRKKLNNQKETKQFLQSSLSFPLTFNKMAVTVNKAIKHKSITNERLADFWKKMDEEFIKVIPWFYLPWYVSKENMITDKVKAGLEVYRKKISKISDFDEALLAVIFPIKKTNFQLEQESMLSLVKLAEKNQDFQTNPDFQKSAKQYLKKYDWLSTFILTPLLPMTFTDLVNRIKKAKEEQFIKNLELQKKANQKNKKLAHKILNIIKKDKRLISDIQNARELGYALTAGIEESYKSSSKFLKFMQLVASRINVPFEHMKLLLSYEVCDALTKKGVIRLEEIEERKKGFAMMMVKGKQYVTFGKDGHDISVWIDTQLNKVDQNISTLKGQIACKGFVTGKVKTASTPSEAHQLQEGEILVCAMTNPDYVPAMRRSGAIITDEGGLLSHASIMSREFGKPCIIGTKIATKVLKDGDYVEVDANTGLVKIFKRKN